MIRAAELRHGNYYLNKYVNSVIKWDCRMASLNRDYIESFDGIEITENILWLLGFEYRLLEVCEVFTYNEFSFYRDNSENKFNFYLLNTDTFTFRYVHELQNLIYSLNKKEL